MLYLHTKKVRIPIYRGNLMIVLTNNVEGLKEYIPEFEDEEIYGHSLLLEDDGETYVIVLNFHHPKRKMYNGVIAHECLHTTHFIASQRGIIADFVNDEPITYLCEWMVDEVYRFMEEKNMVAIS